MRVRLIGGIDDVIGFALAGVESEECRTPAELRAALDAARRDPGVAVVVISPEVAVLAVDAVRQMREAAHLPITIVLPARPEQTAGGAQP